MACKQDESPSVVELADMLYTAIQSFDHKGKTDESTTDEELVSKNAQKLISFLEIEMEPLVPSRQWFLANKVVCELKKRSAELGSGDLEKKPYMRILNQVMKAFDRKLEAAVSSKEKKLTEEDATPTPTYKEVASGEKRGKEENNAVSLALAPSLSGVNQSMITACHYQQHQMQNYVNRYQQQQQQPKQAQFSPQVTPNALFMQQLQQQNALSQQQATGFAFNSFDNPMMPSLIQPFPVPMPQGGPDMFQNDIANPMQQTHISETHSLAASPATNFVNRKYSEIENTLDASSLQGPVPKKRRKKYSNVCLPAVLGSTFKWQTFDCLKVEAEEITDPSYIENMICERFKDKEPQLICPRWHIRHSRLKRRKCEIQTNYTKVLFNCSCKDTARKSLNKSVCVEVVCNVRNPEEPQAVLRWNGVEHCKQEIFQFNTGETLFDAKTFFFSRINTLLEENPEITFDQICEIFHKEHAYDQYNRENFEMATSLEKHYYYAKRNPAKKKPNPVKKIDKKRNNVAATVQLSHRQGSGLDRKNWQTFNLPPETMVEELTNHRYVEKIIFSTLQDSEPQLICPCWHIRHSRLKMRRNIVDKNRKRLIYTCCCNYIGMQYLDKAFCVEISFNRRNAEESQKVLRWNGIGHCKKKCFKYDPGEKFIITIEAFTCRIEALFEESPGIKMKQMFEIFKKEHDFDSESFENFLLAKKINNRYLRVQTEIRKKLQKRLLFKPKVAPNIDSMQQQENQNRLSPHQVVGVGPNLMVEHSGENWQTFNLPPAIIVEELSDHRYVEAMLSWIFQDSEPRLVCPRWHIRHSRLKKGRYIVDNNHKRLMYTCCCNDIGIEYPDKGFRMEISYDRRNAEDSQKILRWNGIGHCKEEIFKFDVEQNPIISYEFFKCRLNALMVDRPGISMKQMFQILKKEHDFDSESNENFTLAKKIYAYYFVARNKFKQFSIQPIPVSGQGQPDMVDNEMPITIQQARLSNPNSVAASRILVDGDDPVNHNTPKIVPEKKTPNGISSDPAGEIHDSNQENKKIRKLKQILGDRVRTWQTFNLSSAIKIEELTDYLYVEELIRRNFQDEPHLICPRWHIRHSRLAMRRKIFRTKITKVMYSCSCTYIGLQRFDEAFCVEVAHDIRNAEGSQTILRWNGVGHCQQEIFRYGFDESSVHAKEFFSNRIETLLEDNPDISTKEIFKILKEEHNFDAELHGNKHLATLLKSRYYRIKERKKQE